MFRKKNILFLTDNFPPEVNAPATRTYEHAKVWASKGVNVTIITSAPNFPMGKLYDGYSNKFLQTEEMDGIKVIRVWTFITANEGFIRRTLDYLSFAVMSFIVGCFIKTDVIIATSPQFFTAVAGRCIALIKRKPWVMEVRDLWPESIVAVGALNYGSLYQLLQKIELILYKSANRIIVVTESFQIHIANRGIPKNKIYVHKNGFLLDNKNSRNLDQEILSKFPQFIGKKLIAYIGTHGMAHGLDFILRAIKKHEKKLVNFHFVFIGDGAEKKKLLQLSEDLNLSSVTFLDPMSKLALSDYLSLIDCSLVNLKKVDTFKSVIPSKIFEAAAMHKPILLGLKGEARTLINEYGAGLCFEPESDDDFVQKCIDIIDPDKYFQYQKGCEKLAVAFDRSKIALDMLTTINEM